MKSGIYKILNWIDGKFYVGCATNLRKRKDDHKYLLRRNKHSNKHLQAAWLNYGESNFQFIVVEYCEKDRLVEREQYWIENSNCLNDKIGYNFCKVANSQFGMKRTEETKRKISEANKGRKCSDEEKERMRIRQTGVKRTSEQRAKMVDAQAKLNYKRKPDKWHHGYICNCLHCKTKKSEYGKNWYKQRKSA